MLPILQTLMHPIMRSWVGVIAQTAEGFPQPGNSATNSVAGPDPISALLIGGGRAAGYGVVDHGMGFTGCLSRSLAQLLGRGVELESFTNVRMTAANAIQAARSADSERHEIILLIVGTYDLVALTPPRSFGRQMETLIEHFEADNAGKTLFVAEIPRLPRVTGIKGVPISLANAHRPRLCSALERVMKQHPSAIFLPLSNPKSADITDRKMSQRYIQWGNEAAQTISTHLPTPPAEAR